MTLIFAFLLVHQAQAARSDLAPPAPATVTPERVARGGGGSFACEERAGTMSNTGTRPWMAMVDRAQPDVAYAGDRRMLDVLQRYLRLCYNNVSSLMKSHGVVHPGRELANLVRHAENSGEARAYLLRTYGLSGPRAERILADLKEMNALEARAGELTPRRTAALPDPGTAR